MIKISPFIHVCWIFLVSACGITKSEYANRIKVKAIPLYAFVMVAIDEDNFDELMDFDSFVIKEDSIIKVIQDRLENLDKFEDNRMLSESESLNTDIRVKCKLSFPFRSQEFYLLFGGYVKMQNEIYLPDTALVNALFHELPEKIRRSYTLKKI